MLSSALRSALLLASRSTALRTAVEKAPLTRHVVDRFVPGTDEEAAVRGTVELVSKGLLVTTDHLGEDVTNRAEAERIRDAYLRLLALYSDAGLSQQGVAEVSIKLSALGQALPGDGPRIATDHALAICEAAKAAGTTVTVDMEDHTTTDLTLQSVKELRADFPWVGAVVQAMLLRTEADCADLAGPGSRVRLCKGAYREPESVAFQDRADIDRSYVRCMKVLMAGQGVPMLATHDPRIIDIAQAVALRHGRGPGDFEYQMLHGVRPDEQVRLAEAGHRMRVYLPYGQEYYGYMMRRMAEKPANLALFLRSLGGRG